MDWGGNLGWGSMTDYLSKVSQTIKQVESSIDEAMGVPAGAAASTQQKTVPQSTTIKTTPNSASAAEPRTEPHRDEPLRASLSMAENGTPKKPLRVGSGSSIAASPVNPTPPAAVRSVPSKEGPRAPAPAVDDKFLEEFLNSPAPSALATPAPTNSQVHSTSAPPSSTANKQVPHESPPTDSIELPPAHNSATTESLVDFTTPSTAPAAVATSETVPPQSALLLVQPAAVEVVAAPIANAAAAAAVGDIFSFLAPTPAEQHTITPATISVPVPSPLEPTLHPALPDNTVTASDPQTSSTAPPVAPLSTSADVAQLQDQVRLLQEVVAQRERQLEALNTSAATLTDQNDKLQQALQAEKAQNRDVHQLTTEFSQRLGEIEKKLAAVSKERDQLRKERDALVASASISAAPGSSNPSSALTSASGAPNPAGPGGESLSKDEEIARLRQEGEALARKQLTLEDTMKKMRKKRSEDEAAIQSLTEKLKDTEVLLQARTERLTATEASLQKNEEALTNLRQVSELTTRKLDERGRQADQLQRQLLETQAALDAARRELQELRQNTSGSEQRAESAAREGEARARAEVGHQMSKLESDFYAREAELLRTVEELRSAVSRGQERAGWREDELRREVQELQARCQAAETRNEELKAVHTDSFRPLMRQIDALQQSLQTKQQLWDQLEMNLTRRLSDAEERAQTAAERERAATTALSETTLKLKGLEAALATERTTVARLRAELDQLRATLDETQRAHQNALAQQEASVARYEGLLKETRAREERLVAEAREQSSRADARIATLEVKVSELQKDKAELSRSGSSLSIPASASSNSLQNMGTTASHISASVLNSTTSTRKRLVMENPVPLSASSGFVPLDKLQATLEQREGEVASLRYELEALERSKAALADELLSLTAKNEQLLNEAKNVNDMRKELADLRQKHAAILEQAHERDTAHADLLADMADIKRLYKQQISEVVDQNNELRRALDEARKQLAAPPTSPTPPQ